MIERKQASRSEGGKVFGKGRKFMQQKRLLQKRTQSGIIVAPSGEKCPNLSLSAPVRITASDICLHGISKMPRLIALRTGCIHQPVQRSPEIPDSLQTIHACIVLHRLDDLSKGAKRSDIVGSGHAVQRGDQLGSVRQSEPRETPT